MPSVSGWISTVSLAATVAGNERVSATGWRLASTTMTCTGVGPLAATAVSLLHPVVPHTKPNPRIRMAVVTSGEAASGMMLFDESDARLPFIHAGSGEA